MANGSSLLHLDKLAKVAEGHSNACIRVMKRRTLNGTLEEFTGKRGLRGESLVAAKVRLGATGVWVSSRCPRRLIATACAWRDGR